MVYSWLARAARDTMLALEALAFALLPGRQPLHRPAFHVVASASSPPTQPFRTVEVAFGKETYGVTVQAAAGAPAGPQPPPPLLLVPPVGVGIDRKFYDRLQVQWAALGAPAAMHSIDLLGTGSATPKPARFYSPEVWADQVDAYIREELKEPCVLVVQGGLLPSALEVWRRSGSNAIAGISVLSPPSLSFFTTQDVDADAGGVASRMSAAVTPPAEPIPGDAALNPPPTAAPTRVRKRDALRRALRFRRRDAAAAAPSAPSAPSAPTRRIQRLVWAVACTPVGNLFFRRLRGGAPPGVRIREFTEQSLFANKADVDDEWLDNCLAGAADSRGRYATFSYLAGSIPAGGAWRDERGALFDAMDVPLQVKARVSRPSVAAVLRQRVRVADRLQQ